MIEILPLDDGNIRLLEAPLKDFGCFITNTNQPSRIRTCG